MQHEKSRLSEICSWVGNTKSYDRYEIQHSLQKHSYELLIKENKEWTIVSYNHTDKR